MTTRDFAANKLTLLAFSGAVFAFLCTADIKSPGAPGWILMGVALVALLMVFRISAFLKTRGSSLTTLLARLDQSLAIEDDDHAEQLLSDARRKLGIGVSQMHLQLDLAEGTLLFRNGRYEEAYLSLERCFLNAFAVNDARYGGESGVLLLKTLVALGRYREACEFALGVREMTASPELDHLVALAHNRRESTAVLC